MAHSNPEEPRIPRPPVPPPPPPALGDNYHCPNCLFLGDPNKPEDGFWACQNLCERD